MPQPEKFICISYPKIDFLIPNAYVFTAVGVQNFDADMMCSADSGIFNFDTIAENFNEPVKDKDVRTMVILKKDNEAQPQTSLVTTSECRVCLLNLETFSLFSDFYTQALAHLGIQACIFTGKRIQFLIDVKKLIDYISAAGIEEII